jgi:uncharacterized protein (DUF1800 family)
MTSTLAAPSRLIRLAHAAAGAALLALAACGGGRGQPDGGGSAAAAGTGAAGAGTAGILAVRSSSGIAAGDSALGADKTRGATSAAADLPASRAEAARFLTQASFGPSTADIDSLMVLGYSAWLDRQFSLPASSHRAWWEIRDALIRAADPTQSAGQDQVWESFWKQAVTGEDQLRQRVAFALSQVFVVSALDGNVGGQPRALAAWLDMLGSQGFGSYRALLEAVALHPLMGFYLSHIRNQKADPLTGRIPDQNFARESMQLFSIGVLKLNSDGTPMLVDGHTVETYGPADVAGLSHVFTGFSYACSAVNSGCFFNGSTGGVSDPDRYFKPMMAYPQYHSTEAKTFLGVTIPAQAVADPAASLRTALDTLAAHPNVAPFLSRQLIQRLVTSNPSSTYVRDVAAVFGNNGSGVRGDLQAVVRAILLHPEAKLSSSRDGKVREPVLRLAAYLRAFPHSSDTGWWRVGNTDSVATSLGQTPLRAPSVFNFFRPGYVAPGTLSAAAGLVAPEMQLLNESSAAGWVNFMRDNLSSGVGQTNTVVNGVTLNRRDLQRDWAAEMALAAQPTALVTAVTDKLLYGRPSAALSADVATAIGRISIPVLNASGSNQAAIDAAKFNRVKSALLLVLASPEFLVQK